MDLSASQQPTTRTDSPDPVASTVNAAWAVTRDRLARQARRESDPHPGQVRRIEALERRCELLEAAIAKVHDEAEGAQLTADIAMERCEVLDATTPDLTQR